MDLPHDDVFRTCHSSAPSPQLASPSESSTMQSLCDASLQTSIHSLHLSHFTLPSTHSDSNSLPTLLHSPTHPTLHPRPRRKPSTTTSTSTPTPRQRLPHTDRPLALLLPAAISQWSPDQCRAISCLDPGSPGGSVYVVRLACPPTGHYLRVSDLERAAPNPPPPPIGGASESARRRAVYQR